MCLYWYPIIWSTWYINPILTMLSLLYSSLVHSTHLVTKVFMLFEMRTPSTPLYPTPPIAWPKLLAKPLLAKASCDTDFLWPENILTGWPSLSFKMKHHCKRPWSCWTPTCPAFANIVDQDQLASANWYRSGPSCSKLTTSLVNDSLKFTSSDMQICWNFFFLKKCE